MKKIIIVGATSGMGRCLAEMFVKSDAKVVILGRRENELKEITSINEECFIPKVCDITDIESLEQVLEDSLYILGSIDLLIISAGIGDINEELKFAIERSTLMTNVLGWTFIADWAMNLFEKQRYGHLVSLSSVAGLRGNGLSPAYNATKAYQINYLEGLCQRTTKFKGRINITDVRPGFVDTMMAKGEGLFWVAPIDKAGKQIYKAIENKQKIVYVTKRWKIIAFILKILPSFIYYRMG